MKTPVRSTITIPTRPNEIKKRIEQQAEVKAPQLEEEQSQVSTSAPEIIKILSQEMFDQNLFQIQEHFRSQNKNLELAILDQKIQVSPEGKIVLQVVGHVQEEIAEKMRPELLRMIRQLSGATQVSILVEQAEEVADDRPKLYTNTDKLRYLKEKHPALAEFQRKFGLEVDF